MHSLTYNVCCVASAGNPLGMCMRELVSIFCANFYAIRGNWANDIVAMGHNFHGYDAGTND